jgi:two-component system NtrC family sensor kinase
MKNDHPKIHNGRDNRESFDIGKTRIYTPFYDNTDFFHLLAENARDLIFHSMVSPTYQFDYVSPSSTHITGYTPEEFYADPFLAKKCILPEDFNLLSDPSRWKDPNNIKPLEIRWRCKDGKIIWTEHMISPMFDKDGNPESFNIIARDITERKQAEIALSESQKFNASLLENAPHATVVINPDTSVKYVNPAWERLNGWTLSEIAGTKIPYPWWPAEYKDAFSEQFRAAIQLGSGKGEVISQKKNGEIYWIDLNWASVVNNGKLLYLVINSVDITERKRMEEALRESEEKFSVAFRSSPDIMAIASLRDGKYTEVNDSYTNCLGYTREELIGHTAEELNIWVYREQAERMIQALKEKGEIRDAEHSVRTKDGKIRTWLCSADIISINGESCMLAAAADITKQKEVETKLQEHKKIIDSILATMPEGVLVIDDKENILLANKALYKIFRFNSRSLKNKTFSDVFPKEHFFDLHKAVKGKETDKKSLEFRYQVQGLEKIINCVTVKMDGERTLISFSDISREREEEEKLYLTARLASIGEMAAGLAHELNNPLTGILGLSQMLTHSNLSSEHKEDLECINTEAKRAASIVKNVLLFAHNKTGENSQCSVNEVVKNVLKLREFEERISNITIVTNLEENLPSILVDQSQVQQVFLNLISNAEAAIKEVDRPGIITIATQRTNNHINIVFSDNGCGIKKQNIPRIFDPFFTTKEIGRGTGLGLSICYSIIVKHGGKINVKSQVNEGTTFTIRMPLVQ